jgi:hypothetical protein
LPQRGGLPRQPNALTIPRGKDIINIGIILEKDGWALATKDKKLPAQWENTILVTDSGVDVLTLRNEESK